MSVLSEQLNRHTIMAMGEQINDLRAELASMKVAAESAVEFVAERDREECEELRAELLGHANARAEAMVEILDLQEVIKKLSTELSDMHARHPEAACYDVPTWDKLRAENEKLRVALAWYRDEAIALSKNVASGAHTQAVLASVTVLSLDAGRRATEALS